LGCFIFITNDHLINNILQEINMYFSNFEIRIQQAYI